MYTRAAIAPESFNESDNTIEVVFATETRVTRRPYWSEPFVEILNCDTSSVMLERLNSGGPVVDSHRTWSIDDQFAVVVRAWVDNSTKECRAVLRLSTAESDKSRVQKIKDGIVRNVSVGYDIHEARIVEGDENKIPELYATKWEPAEISFTPVPADYLSGSRSKNEQIQLNPLKIQNQIDMSDNKAALEAERKRSAEIFKACRAAGLDDNFATELVDGGKSLEDCLSAIRAKQAPPTPPQQQPPAPSAEEVVKQERTRAKEIRTAAANLKLPAEFADGLIDEGVTLDQARAKMIEELGKRNPSPAPSPGHVGTDEADKKSRGMIAALLLRSGSSASKDVKPEDAAEYRGFRLLDLAKECLEISGVKTRGMQPSEAAQAALEMRATRSVGGHSSADFPNILANVMNKTLRAEYATQQRTFQPFCYRTTASDFKEMTRTQLFDFELKSVKEGGEYQYATMGEGAEKFKVAKWGRLIKLDWETIINDDLSAFNRIPTKAASTVAQLQSDQIYAILTGTHNMADGKTLFHADHANLAGSGAALSVDSLGLARAAMRKHKVPGSASSFINIEPKFLIVGPDNEQKALQFLSSNYVAAESGKINVWQGTMTPIVDARITGNAWYLAASPSSIDTIEYSILEGEEMHTESKYAFDHDAWTFKIRTVFGCKAIDYRGFYKNPGA